MAREKWLYHEQISTGAPKWTSKLDKLFEYFLLVRLNLILKCNILLILLHLSVFTPLQLRILSSNGTLQI